MEYIEDDKAQRLVDVFPGVGGQVNVAYHHDTNVITAWHKHEFQTDRIICLKGSFKVGLVFDDERLVWLYASDKNQQVITASAGVWHGWRAVEPGSIMLYHMSTFYDPDDIQKAPPDSFGAVWFPEDG